MDEERIRFQGTETLSRDSDRLKKTSFNLKARDGEWIHQDRETYRRDDGATVLLYNLARRTVVLTRQFRLPVHMHGEPGYLVETVAGVLEGADPAMRIKEEIKEETGFEVDKVRPVGRAYMSPAAVVELVHLFIAEYEPGRKARPGGGLHEEGEDIEVLEMPFDEAYAMVERGEIVDGKTIILLQHARLSIFADGAQG